MPVFHKVKEVVPLQDMRLCVRFANGSTKEYDVETVSYTHLGGRLGRVRHEPGWRAGRDGRAAPRPAPVVRRHAGADVYKRQKLR